MIAIEVVGVRSAFWSRDTGEPRTSVLITADRIAAGEDPYELARYLSSGNDAGAASFSPATGGATMVRQVAGDPLALFAGGSPTTLKHQAFDGVFLPLTEHTTHIEQRDMRCALHHPHRLFFGQCQCGWSGPVRVRRSSAVADGDTHIDTFIELS